MAKIPVEALTALGEVAQILSPDALKQAIEASEESLRGRYRGGVQLEPEQIRVLVDNALVGMKVAGDLKNYPLHLEAGTNQQISI